MNVVTRGIKNALRSPMRSGAIVLMLAISIGLILSMLVARSSVNAKIDEVKATTGTTISISPAGVNGFAGGGDALTSEQLASIKSIAHIASTTATLSDQMSSTDTSLTPSLTLGNFGARQMRFESSGTDGTTGTTSSESSTLDTTSARPAPTPRTMVTGTTNPDSISTDGNSLNITSGKTFDASNTELVALVGTDLATKNSLSVGSTFTAYTKTITVIGIYKTGNTFQDSSVIMPLAAVQTLTDQAGAVSSIKATVDNSSNVDSVVASLKSTLGTKADITSEAAQAKTSIASLETIAGLALAGVIGSTIAGAVIVLLAMIMIVRERRREIGVIKAIGGTNNKVIAQFVTEALTLTIIGTVIGLAIGVAVSGPMTTSLVASNTSTTNASTPGTGGGPGAMMRGGFSQINKNLTSVTSTLTPTTFISAISITLLIAIIGSAVPAWFIARIRPAEVLRSE